MIEKYLKALMKTKIQQFTVQILNELRNSLNSFLNFCYEPANNLSKLNSNNKVFIFYNSIDFNNFN